MILISSVDSYKTTNYSTINTEMMTTVAELQQAGAV